MLSQIPIDAFVNQTVALKCSDKLSDDRPSMPLGPCALTNDVGKVFVMFDCLQVPQVESNPHRCLCQPDCGPQVQ